MPAYFCAWNYKNNPGIITAINYSYQTSSNDNAFCTYTTWILMTFTYLETEWMLSENKLFNYLLFLSNPDFGAQEARTPGHPPKEAGKSPLPGGR